MKLEPKKPMLFVVLCVTAIGMNSNGKAQPDSSEDVVIVDGLMWSLVTSDPVPWSEANDFCDTLELNGFSDWRLPSLAELQTLHDPTAPNSVRGPFELDDCCAWSALNLTDLSADPKGNLPEPGGPPAAYYWGLLLDGGISYYSNGSFADGFAMCLREPSA